MHPVRPRTRSSDDRGMHALQSTGPFETLSTAVNEQVAVWIIEEIPREMEGFNGLGMGLGTLSRLSAAQTRSISAENPTGGAAWRRRGRAQSPPESWDRGGRSRHPSRSPEARW